MKKFFVLLIIFLCAGIIFFACVQNKSDKAKTSIKFSSWGSQSETAMLLPLIKDFESKNPDIKVEFIHIPQNYFQKLHLLFASNLAPDVVFLNNYYAPKYVKAGLLEDITPYINKKEFFDKSLDGFTFEKRIYAVPRDVSELVIYYNKDLFKKNHISFPSKYWTLNDYLQISKKLSKDTNNDGKNDLWGTSFETDTLFLLPFLMSSGASILGDDKKTITITESAAIKAINQYSDFANKYNAAPRKSQSASLTMAQLFLQERIAMHISGRWLVPKYREEAKFDWDIAPFPQGIAGSVVNLDSSGYAVSKTSKHKKEAFRFVNYLSSKSSMDMLAQSGLIVPARIDSAYSNSFLSPDKKPKNAVVFLETVKNGKPTPVNENYQKITDKLNIILEPVFLGQKKAEDVLSTAVLIDFYR